MHTIAIRVIKVQAKHVSDTAESARMKAISLLRLKKAELLLMEDNWVREHLNKLNMRKSILPQTLREVADVTKRPL